MSHINIGCLQKQVSSQAGICRILAKNQFKNLVVLAKDVLALDPLQEH